MLPAFSHQFLFHDDWYHYASKTTGCIDSGLYKWFIYLGRPIGYQILCIQFGLIHSISMSYMGRLVTLMILIALVMAIYSYLNRIGLPKSLSSLIAFGIATLPGSLTAITWIGSGFVIASLLSSVISNLLCLYIIQGKNLNKFALLILYAGAILFLVSAYMIYQTGAMFFLLFALIFVIFQEKLSTKILFKAAKIHILVFFCASLAYLMWFKIYAAENLAKIDPARGSLFKNIPEGLFWFIQYPLPRAFKLWMIEPSYGWDYSTIFILVSFVSATVFYANSRNKIFLTKKWSIKFLFLSIGIFGLLLISFSPMLASNFRLEVYRSTLVLSACIFMIFSIEIWGLSNFYKVQTSLISYFILIMMVMIAILSHYSLQTKLVLPKFKEVKIIQSAMMQIKDNALGNAPTHLIIPKFSVPWNTDEVGYLTSQYAEEIPTMMSIIRSEAGLPSTLTTYSEDGEVFDLDGKIIIDLTKDLNVKQDLFNGYNRKNKEIYSNAKDVGSVHFSGRAFDGSLAADDFWEVSLESPENLYVEFPKSRELIGYQFYSKDLPSRMPISWSLYGSNNGLDWKVIDEQNGIFDWDKNPVQKFEIQSRNKARYKFLRFVFNKSQEGKILRIYEIKIIFSKP